MQPIAAARTITPVRPITDRLPALGVLAFGFVLLFGVGFSTLSIAHNAAHDTRHATGFPCH